MPSDRSGQPHVIVYTLSRGHVVVHDLSVDTFLLALGFKGREFARPGWHPSLGRPPRIPLFSADVLSLAVMACTWPSCVEEMTLVRRPLQTGQTHVASGDEEGMSRTITMDAPAVFSAAPSATTGCSDVRSTIATGVIGRVDGLQCTLRVIADRWADMQDESDMDDGNMAGSDAGADSAIACMDAASGESTGGTLDDDGGLHPIHIVVKSLDNLTTHTLDVLAECKIEHLKASIPGIPPSCQYIMFQAQPLQNGHTLADYNIKCHDMIHVSDKRTMLVLVNTWPGNVVAVPAVPDLLIRVLKERIHALTGIPTYQQILFYAGKQLANGRTLQGYNIRKTSVVNLIRRLHLADCM